MRWICTKPGCPVDGEHRHIAQWYDGILDQNWYSLSSFDMTYFLNKWGETTQPPIVWEGVEPNPRMGDIHRVRAALARICTILGMSELAEGGALLAPLVLETVLARLEGSPTLSETERIYQERLDKTMKALESLMADTQAIRGMVQTAGVYETHLAEALTAIVRLKEATTTTEV